MLDFVTMELFKGENIISFFDTFKTDFDCLDYLAHKKWDLGYTCKKCGHTKCTIRKKNLARDCNNCHHIESPTGKNGQIDHLDSEQIDHQFRSKVSTCFRSKLTT